MVPLPRVVPRAHRLRSALVPGASQFGDAAVQQRMAQQLMDLARAYSTDQMAVARKSLLQLRRTASPEGAFIQRLTHYMLCALVNRFEGHGTPEGLILPSPIKEPPSVRGALEGVRRIYGRWHDDTTLPPLKEALLGARRIHIVVFSSSFCPDWADLFRCLARQGDAAPASVRVSIVFHSLEVAVFPQLRDEFLAAGQSVLDAAAAAGLQAQCSVAVVAPAEVTPSLVAVHPGETLAVVAWLALCVLPDDQVLRHNPRDALLKWIHAQSPRIFLMCDVDSDHNSPFFLARFGEAIRLARAVFQNTDETAIRESADTKTSSTYLFEYKVAIDLMNCVSCDGLARFERAESLARWRDRMLRLGFSQVALSHSFIASLRPDARAHGLDVESVDGIASIRRNGSPLQFVAIWR